MKIEIRRFFNAPELNRLNSSIFKTNPFFFAESEGELNRHKIDANLKQSKKNCLESSFPPFQGLRGIPTPTSARETPLSIYCCRNSSLPVSALIRLTTRSTSSPSFF
jgi:hypothetical protein